MPANNAYFIQKFLDQFPVIINTLGTTLVNTVGIREPKLYEHPKEENVIKIKILLQTLVDFEISALEDDRDGNEEVKKLFKKIMRLMEDLELYAIRPKESGVDKDWIMFAPRIIDKEMPVKIAAVLVYRFGFIRNSSKDLTDDHTVGNIALVSEHSGADGAERLTADVFIKGKAKFILANLFRPHTLRNPNFDPEKRSSVEYFTDPAHSDTTIFLPMLQTLLQDLFPEIPVLVMHGMGSSPIENKFQTLIGNCYGKFRKDGWRSFANMLAISFGVEDYFINQADEDANKPFPVVAVQSSIPNSVLKGDQIVPMSSDSEGVNGALRYPERVISSNVTGHIGYYAKKVLTETILKNYECSDRMIHVETTGYVRANEKNNHPHRDKFVNVVLRAMKWFERYDPAIHDPHKLKTRFVKRAENMKLYDDLFSFQKIASYKSLHKEEYANDTAAYAAAFAAKNQLPPDFSVMFSAGFSAIADKIDKVASVEEAEENSTRVMRKKLVP